MYKFLLITVILINLTLPSDFSLLSQYGTLAGGQAVQTVRCILEIIFTSKFTAAFQTSLVRVLCRNKFLPVQISLNVLPILAESYNSPSSADIYIYIYCKSNKLITLNGNTVLPCCVCVCVCVVSCKTRHIFMVTSDLNYCLSCRQREEGLVISSQVIIILANNL